MQFRDPRKTCVVICTGESAGRISRESLRRIRAFTRIVVNDAYILEPDADALYAADPRWWEWHAKAVAAQFKGRRFCPETHTAQRFGLEHVKLERREGLSVDGTSIRTGGQIGNSGAQAINLAVLHGARRIVLVGMDMGGSHFFGRHPKNVHSDSDFKGMVRGMCAMAADLYRYGIDVINTSDCSSIAYWPNRQPIPSD
jgi:hypothetical protein